MYSSRSVVPKFFCRHIQRERHYWKSMELLQPPTEVRGMLQLQRDAFRKTVNIPRLRVTEQQAYGVLPLLKKLLLKMEQLRPVRPLEQSNGWSGREVLLHPLPVKSWADLPVDQLQDLQVRETDFFFGDLELGYENFRADEIFRSVLPPDTEGLTSFSRIGHIVHLNLRDHLLPYKALIGHVLMDKVPGCRTVVNKTANIQTTYRFFELELICGHDDYKVETKENGVWFEFDFSRVYWNPRLSTEHERIVEMLHADDVLYDVFAGVGPFSVPAAKKRCHVLANDLNPESYRWLQQNMKRNKCQAAEPQLFNKDGRQFIVEDVRTDLLKRWRAHDAAKQPPSYAMHITMNLPAMAVEFLPAFRGLFAAEAADGDLKFAAEHFNYPIVHVYTFARGPESAMEARRLVEEQLATTLDDDFLLGIHYVRNVAPNKDMYRVSFRLTADILTTKAVVSGEDLETSRKRAVLELDEDEDEEHCISPKIQRN